MIKIISSKKLKDLKDYISHLELKIIDLNNAYEMKKKEYDELEKKYKRVKLELYLKNGGE